MAIFASGAMTKQRESLLIKNDKIALPMAEEDKIHQSEDLKEQGHHKVFTALPAQRYRYVQLDVSVASAPPIYSIIQNVQRLTRCGIMASLLGFILKCN